ncbi:hybrid sensor histidine kinase/response regulator [Allosediminivita pacifica]|uniref:Sensory/regulatory protein RpfC n=1 Tax=Allosediminivita pacifica TaxID=1267769 RepID=A0A2T6B3Y2_9RHOB|nr:PAS domain-containing hybrid sensor histidine kinase/response regulator [Allosediminivita pacifica]PTX50733.1 PAS domain S-box-containing protein [Allosediminivita pacifica]GGB00765.1 hypothetical protein GCM10011324_08790 [Allosediminivita pacifica]
MMGIDPEHILIYLGLLGILIFQATRYRASSRRLTALTRQLSDAERIARIGTVRWDFVRDVVTWSDEYARMLALEPGGVMTGAEFQGMLLPEYEEAVVESERVALEASRKSGRPERREVTYQVRARDGRVLEVEALSELLADDKGTPIHLLSTVRDVTEEARQRRELRESEDKLAAAVRVAELGIFREDFKSGDIYWSDEFHRHVGRPVEAGPVTFSRVMGENGQERLQQRLDELTREATPYHVHRNTVDAVLTRIDGAEINVRVAVELTFDGEGKPHVMSGVLRDVTDEIERENKLKDAVAEAERANEAKTEFLAVMSHELRTPMNGVLGMLGVLEDTPLSPEQREQLSIARSSANALLVILNDILDASKIEAGRLELEEGPFELYGLVRSVIHLYAQKARDKGVLLDSRIAEDIPPWITADSGRIRQVLANLVSNSVKFTEKGSVILEVKRLEPRGDEPLRLRFCVTDTGPGIPAEHQSRVFAKFDQLGASYSNRLVGTGLGLSISRSLVEMMHGEIDFESTEGEGTVFWIDVPVRPAEAHGEASPARPLPELPRMRILVAEDNSTNQIVARAMLDRLGQNTDIVRNGAEAVEALEQFDYDLVLMDVSMPVMDGTAATRRIRELPSKAAQIPIIGLTAHIRPDQQAHFREAGFDEVLTKPLIREQLAMALDRWKDPAARRGEPVETAATAVALQDTAAPASAPEQFEETDDLRARVAGLFSEFGPEVAGDMLRAALSDLDRHLVTLEAETPTVTDEPPRDQRRRALHSVSGISATLGCPGFAARCRALESLDDARAEAPSDFRALTDVIRSFHAELSRLLSDMAPEKLSGEHA